MADLSLESARRHAREAGEDLVMVGRLARDVPAFLRRPVTLDAARGQTVLELRQRERRFLRLVDHAIYARPSSPYRWLLAQAGCEPGDLHALVRQEGLEGALHRLAAVGVYVRFDELKGQSEIVRGSARLTVPDRDFDNPFCRPHFPAPTGGSRGRPTRVRRSLGGMGDMAVTYLLAQEAHGIRNPRNVIWIGPAPVWAFINAKMGRTVDAWFSPTHPLPRVARAGFEYVRVLARLAGHRLPALQYCPLQEPERIVRWIAEHHRGDRPLLVNTRVSSAVRIAVAASQHGQPLAGVTFHARSEPLSDARRRLIEQTGARVLPDYAATEMSGMAYGCPDATASDDLHLATNRYAAIERERAVFENGPAVRALLMTALTPTNPKVILNTEPGDSARIEQRACGCALGSIGLRTHLSEIRSFEKLSSEGSTFARGNVLQILETVLPARFGGSALDYQLVEEEGGDAATLLVLRVHPSVGPLDEGALRTTLLAELGQDSAMDAYQAELIRRAESVVIRRLPPLATRAGKVLPFQLARAGAEVAAPV